MKTDRVTILLAGLMTVFVGSMTLNGFRATEEPAQKELKAKVDDVVENVSLITPLSAACKEKARILVEMTARRRINEVVGNQEKWKEQEEDALMHWNVHDCPSKALLGLTFGASSIVVETWRL